ncbi:MAG: hypothetical protein N2450_09370 [bacterium]|nr:hypothetical protein [bacterium]
MNKSLNLLIIIIVQSIIHPIKSQTIEECDVSYYDLPNKGVMVWDQENCLILHSNLKEIVLLNSKEGERRFQLKNVINPTAIQKDQRHLLCYDKGKNVLKRYNHRFDEIEEISLPSSLSDALLNHFMVTSKGEMIFFNTLTNEVVAFNRFGKNTWKKYLPIDFQKSLITQQADTTWIVTKSIDEENKHPKWTLFKVYGFGVIEQKTLNQFQADTILALSMNNNQFLFFLTNGVWTENGFYQYPDWLRKPILCIKGAWVLSEQMILYSDDRIYFAPVKLLLKN